MSNLDMRRFFPDTPSNGGRSVAQTDPAPVGDTFLSHYLELARQNLAVILGAVSIGAVLGGGMAYNTLVTDPVFRASAKITVQPSDAELDFSRDFVRSSSFDSVNVLTQSQMEYLLSRETLRRVSDRLDALGGAAVADEPPEGLKALIRQVKQALRRLDTGRFVEPDPETARLGDLQDAITLNMIESSFIMQILVEWSDPTEAALIANTLAEVYRDRRTQEATASAAEFTRYLDGLRATARADIDRLIQQRSALRDRYDVLDLTAEREALLARISVAQTDRDETRAALQALNSMLATYPESDATVQSRRGGLSADVRDSLALDRIRQVELTELLAARDAGVDALRTRLAGLGAAEVPLGRVEEDLAAARQRLDDVEQRIVDAGLVSAGSIEGLRIIDRAAAPLYPSAPGTLKSAVAGGAVGLLLVLMAIFGRDLRDTRVRTRADLRELFDLRVLNDIALKGGRGTTIHLRDPALLGWMGIQQTSELLLLDAGARHRAAALGFALSKAMPGAGPDLRVHYLATLRHGTEDMAARTSAVLLTLPRGKIDREDLVERIADPRRQFPGVRLALAFLDVPKACLKRVDARLRSDATPLRHDAFETDATTRIPDWTSDAKDRPKLFRIKNARAADRRAERV